MLGVSRADPALTSTCHVVVQRNADRHLYNECVYCTDGMQRSRDKDSEAYLDVLFTFSCALQPGDMQKVHKI
jgi:hypothetical protein